MVNKVLDNQQNSFIDEFLNNGISCIGVSNLEYFIYGNNFTEKLYNEMISRLEKGQLYFDSLNSREKFIREINSINEQLYGNDYKHNIPDLLNLAIYEIPFQDQNMNLKLPIFHLIEIGDIDKVKKLLPHIDVNTYYDGHHLFDYFCYWFSKGNHDDELLGMLLKILQSDQIIEYLPQGKCEGWYNNLLTNESFIKNLKLDFFS